MSWSVCQFWPQTYWATSRKNSDRSTNRSSLTTCTSEMSPDNSLQRTQPTKWTSTGNITWGSIGSSKKPMSLKNCRSSWEKHSSTMGLSISELLKNLFKPLSLISASSLSQWLSTSEWEERPLDRPGQERLNPSKPSELNWVDLSSCSTVMRHLTSMPWAGFLWDCARLAHGAVSMSLTDLKKECSQLCLSRFWLSSSD